MRVDPPAGPIHTRPYGPARRALVAKYDGPYPLTAQQADQIRDVMQTRLPGWDVLIAEADRWTFQTLTNPEPNTEERTP